MTANLKRRAAGLVVSRRIIKPVPFVGMAFTLGFIGYEMKKKGAWRGVAHVGLDVLPVVGTAKAIVELFTGHLIPDKKEDADAPVVKRRARTR